MTFGYYMQYKTITLLLTLIVTIAHFSVSKFAMLKTDWKYIFCYLIFWVVINLSMENNSTGLFFAELKGTKNIIKVSLAGFMIAATYYLHDFICANSQRIKGYKDEIEAIKNYTKKGTFANVMDEENLLSQA